MRLVVNNEMLDLKVAPEHGFLRCSDVIALLNRVMEERGDVEIRVWDDAAQDYVLAESAEFLYALNDMDFVGLI